MRELLRQSIDRLPGLIQPDAGGLLGDVGVMRRWTHKLPLRVQGTLLTSIRGCDGAPKEDPSKSITRMIRRAIMNPADERETTSTGGFFGLNRRRLESDIIAFLESMDQYPMHYVTHLIHACEIIGYLHPDPEQMVFFNAVYEMAVCAMHFSAEPKAQMMKRFTEDRVALGTVESGYPDLVPKPTVQKKVEFVSRAYTS